MDLKIQVKRMFFVAYSEEEMMRLARGVGKRAQEYRALLQANGVDINELPVGQTKAPRPQHRDGEVVLSQIKHAKIEIDFGNRNLPSGPT